MFIYLFCRLFFCEHKLDTPQSYTRKNYKIVLVGENANYVSFLISLSISIKSALKNVEISNDNWVTIDGRGKGDGLKSVGNG